jgi:hypothetical protein
MTNVDSKYYSDVSVMRDAIRQLISSNDLFLIHLMNRLHNSGKFDNVEFVSGSLELILEPSEHSILDLYGDMNDILYDYFISEEFNLLCMNVLDPTTYRILMGYIQLPTSKALITNVYNVSLFSDTEAGTVKIKLIF